MLPGLCRRAPMPGRRVIAPRSPLRGVAPERGAHARPIAAAAYRAPLAPGSSACRFARLAGCGALGTACRRSTGKARPYRVAACWDLRRWAPCLRSVQMRGGAYFGADSWGRGVTDRLCNKRRLRETDHSAPIAMRFVLKRPPSQRLRSRSDRQGFRGHSYRP